MAAHSQYNDSACADNPQKCDTPKPEGSAMCRALFEAARRRGQA